MVIYHDFHGLKLPYLFFISKIIIYYKEGVYVKKNICWWITLAATSLTRHPPPFKEDKNSPKLKDCQIFVIFVIRVFGYSNTGVH